MKPKMAYEDWHPVELSYDSSNESAIADTVMRTLDDEGVCVLQGPPGSGKSYTIAQIAAHYLNEGKTVCATTMANKGLMELAQQPPLKEILSAGRTEYLLRAARFKLHRSVFRFGNKVYVR